jgi:hypothetical protein
MYCKVNIVIKIQILHPCCVTCFVSVLFLVASWHCARTVYTHTEGIQNDFDGGCCSAGNKLSLHTVGCPREVS